MLKSNDQNISTIAKKGWFSEDRLAYISILFTLGMGAATAYALTRVDYLSNDTDFVMWLIIIDALALVVLGTLVGRQIWRLWSERRQRLAGHQLHWRMAVLFGGGDHFSGGDCDALCAFCGRLFAAGLVCRAHFNRGE